MSGDQAKRVRRVQSGVVNGMSGGLRVVGSMTSTNGTGTMVQCERSDVM